MASLVVTAHYNTSVSEEISVFAAWSTGNDQDYNYERRFGCREIKVPSAPIFFNTVYRIITVTNAFFNILINHYIVCEQAFIFKHHVVGRTVGIISESVSVTDSLSRLTRDYPSTFFLVYIFKCVITLCI